MKKHIQRIILALCVLCCTACFDLQENLFLKKDGSGTFSFIINMEQVKSMMSMFDGLNNAFDNKDARNEGKDKDSKKSSTDKFNETFEKTRRKLLNTPGISHVKIIEDTVHYNFGIAFDFKDVTALNEGLNRLFEDDSLTADKKAEKVTYFEYKDHQLKRLEALDSKSFLGKSNALSDDDNPNNAPRLFDPEKLFNTVTYTTNYEFEEKVSSVQNERSMLSSSMQKVTLTIHPFVTPKDSTEKKQTIANTITFK